MEHFCEKSQYTQSLNMLDTIVKFYWHDYVVILYIPESK